MPRGQPSPKIIFAQQKRGRVLVSVAAEHCGVNRATPWRWAIRGDVHSAVVKGFRFVSLADCERMVGK